jgi:hypothetical protein
LLRARDEIHGTTEEAYGLTDPEAPPGEDPVENVARQVSFHERLITAQQARLDSSRFRVISYERFCADPGGLAREVAEWLGMDRETAVRTGAIAPFRVSDRVRLSAEVDARLAGALKHFRATGAPST